MAKRRPSLEQDMQRFVAHEIYHRGVVDLNTSGKPDPLTSQYRDIPTMVKNKKYGRFIQEAHDTVGARHEVNRELMRDIGAKVLAQPDVELDDFEVRVLYGLDVDYIPTEDYRSHIDIQTKRFGNKEDIEAMARALPEVIREQLTGTYAAYHQVSQMLGVEEVSAFDFEHFFGLKEREWQEKGVYQYLASLFINRNGSQSTLVATPNVEVDIDQIVELGDAMSTRSASAFPNPLYSGEHYSPKAWSGTKGNDLIRWSLIPDEKFRLATRLTPGNMKKHLRVEQQSRPELDFRIPSVLDAVTHWYARRANGKKVDTSQTKVVHFDMGPTKEKTYASYNTENVIPVTWFDGYYQHAHFSCASMRNREHSIQIAFG